MLEDSEELECVEFDYDVSDETDGALEKEIQPKQVLLVLKSKFPAIATLSPFGNPYQIP